ncbi:MAG: hypothetical protein H6615_11355 [Ignavibacteria bacterium]|nr:hypothetical protein [Ignavibacteria bacterium]
MNNIGATIIEKENLSVNIERLAAQREMYSLGKTYFNLQLIFNVLITVLLLVVGLLLNHFCEIKIDWIRTFYAFTILLIDNLVITSLINQLRQKASSVQEVFDCDVLNIDWNKILVGDKPHNEEVNKFYKKHLNRVKDLSNLKNWYAISIGEIKNNAAKLICQRSNFYYDFALRNYFIRWVIGIAVTLLIIIVFSSCLNDVSTRTLFISGLFPYLPILSMALRLYNEHMTSIKNLESLKSTINSAWSNLLKKEVVSEQTIRQIQDKIFLNRKSNPLIPDKMYNKLRSNLEEQMYYSVNLLVEEYKTNNQVGGQNE